MSSFLLFQSTRPCGARLTEITGGTAIRLVSIHAPVRGATRARYRGRQRRRVSIHAPVRGATSNEMNSNTSQLSFNPRARAGRDVNSLPKGQTFAMFQSTRPCGARPMPMVVSTSMIEFQSTRPCGARPDLIFQRCVAFLFQSTRPCGARLADQEATGAITAVSIHAPVRGATIYIYNTWD